MKRVCSIGLILIGLCVIAYPKVRDAYYDKKEAEILDAWEKVSFELEQRQPDEELPLRVFLPLEPLPPQEDTLGALHR